MPIFALWKIAPGLPKTKWIKSVHLGMLVLSFTLVSLNVRQFYQGSYLGWDQFSNLEIYTYSVAWVFFGIALLFLGTFKKDRMIRIASLFVMICTAGKVFLYDASALEGLFRVFSFFGLGLSLLCLSWFYTKFVFGGDDLIKDKNIQS